MNVMNLEIDDYLKTIENLNQKLQTKDTECNELKTANEEMGKKIVLLDSRKG